MAFNFGGGGTTSTPAAGFSFGSTAAPTTAASTGFGFGAVAAPKTTAAATTGFSFGAPAAAATPAAIATPAAAATGFGFGTTPAATTSAAGTGLTFGAPAAATTTSQAAAGFGFGAPGATSTAAATGFSLGTTAATAASTGFGFGLSSTTTSSTTTAALGGFGAPAASTAAAGGFGGFGLKTAATTAAGAAPPAFGGFGAPAAAAGTATTTAATGFGGLAAPASTAGPGLGGSTTAPAAIGFGGSTAPSFGQTAPTSQASTEQKTENKNIKDNMIPGELGVTVDDLKKHIKGEKSVCSDISHISDKPYKKLQEETDALAQLVTALATGIHKNRLSLEKLKLASAQELLNVEIAQRTKETPASMQYENVAPMEYFIRLVSTFESDMSTYRKEIDQTQQHLQLLGSGGSITSEDITQAVKRLHSAFTELAAKYQVIHQTLAKCKEQYIAVHRKIHGTSVPAFERKSAMVLKVEPALQKISGPSPFSSTSDPLVQARAALPNKSQQTLTAGMGPPTLGLNMSTTPAGAFGSFSGNQSFGAGGFGANTTGFGANTSAFGGNTSGFGGNTSTFGGNTSGFGGNTSGFGANTSGFGGNTSGFGANTTGFGNTSGFGTSNLFGSTSFSSPVAGNKRNKV